MTTVYFIRHAQADISTKDENRPLTEKGLTDRALVTAFLQDKDIQAVFSSPFRRAIDTIADFAQRNGLDIETIENFRERKNDWLGDDDFWSFVERQWSDFSYSLGGECLANVQERNIAALNIVLERHKGKNIVIGTHGTALSTIINYYDPTFGFTDFMAMVHIMPWVVKMEFSDEGCAGMEKIDLFRLGQKPNYDECVVHLADSGQLKAYRFTVIFARYQNKWLYCRAKERDVFETAGGHIEPGETPLEGAKRELFEETGAIRYDIFPAFDYSVHRKTGYANGQVFIAKIDELGEIPDFEMAEVRLFDTIPDRMRFPKILPVLFERVNELNTAISADFKWRHCIMIENKTVPMKYVRIQGREIAYRTGMPVGIFAAVHRLLQAGLLTEEEKAVYHEIDQVWFQENLPNPPFYDDDKPGKPITWFKTASTKIMLEKLKPLRDILEKYAKPYDIVYTNFPGRIVYEDEWQVAVYSDNTAGRISPLSLIHLPIYAEVIRQNFATVAQDFGLTPENCPGYTGFISNERLESKFEGAYYPFGYFTDGKLVGFASLTDMGHGIYEMNNVSILPDYRHFGYGKALLDFCKEKVIGFGGRKIIIGIIEENSILKDWYIANGFVHTGTKIFEHLPFTVGFMEWS